MLNLQLREIFVVGVMALATAGTALGQEPVEEPIPAILMESLRESKERYIGNLLHEIRKHGQDRNRLDQASVERSADIEMARMRANYITSELVNDIDGDGRISADEVRARLKQGGLNSLGGTTQKQRKDEFEKRVESWMSRDHDRDGYITMRELLSSARSNSKINLSPVYSMTRRLFEVDPNKDGVLTIEELERLASETFDRFDQDGNGWIDLDERFGVSIAHAAARRHEKKIRHEQVIKRSRLNWEKQQKRQKK